MPNKAAKQRKRERRLKTLAIKKYKAQKRRLLKFDGNLFCHFRKIRNILCLNKKIIENIDIL